MTYAEIWAGLSEEFNVEITGLVVETAKPGTHCALCTRLFTEGETVLGLTAQYTFGHYCLDRQACRGPMIHTKAEQRRAVETAGVVLMKGA